MLLALHQIKLSENRQRREFDPQKLMELATSIQISGLINPIGVRKEGDSFVLVHGERRLRAIKDYLWPLGNALRHGEEAIPEGWIPCLTLGELDPLAAEEAELAENIHRTDLTWQERAQATQRVAQLRTKQAAAAGLPPPGVRDIAAEVRDFDPQARGRAYDDTRRELIVAKHLENAAVAGAKTLDDAWKVLKRAEEVAKHQELAKAVGANFHAGQHQLFNEDAVELLAKLDSDLYDVILTDPPYGMGADEFGDAGGAGGAVGGHRYADDEENFMRCLKSLAHEGYRVAKPQAHLYVFCDIDRFADLRGLFAEAGWRVHRTPLIWHKPTAARLPWPQHGPQRKWEMILYAVKGDRMVNYVAPDLVSCPPDPNLGHQAQKPVNLMVDLLRRSIRPGDRVLDPFAGSGPVLTAAHELSCYATLIERDAASYGLCARRLQTLIDQEAKPEEAP